MAITEKQKLQKEIDKLQKKRDKSSKTYEIVRLATKIKNLKKKLDKL